MNVAVLIVEMLRGQIQDVNDVEAMSRTRKRKRVKAGRYRAVAWNRDEQAHRRTHGSR
jgi:hypothetical protein